MRAPCASLTPIRANYGPTSTRNCSGCQMSVVKNYVNQPADAGQTFDPKNVMHYFTPKQVPVISRLARQFAVCDRWFASAPCQTWPNRWFVHAATADGYENNRPIHLPDVETIYNRFEQAGIGDWKIYFH